MELAKHTGASVTGNAPDVTPYNNTNHNNVGVNGRQRVFADFSVTSGGITVTYDPTVFSPFTVSAREEAQRPRMHGENRCIGHSALHPEATCKRRGKYIDKLEGTIDRGSQFAPITHARNGAFIPQDTEILGVHSDMLLKLLQTTKLGKHGDRPLSFEEHTIRKWARKAADTKDSGYGIFDTTMELKPAAGLITSHVYSKIAFTSIKHSCDAVIDALHDNDISVDISQRQGLFQLGNLNAQHSTPSSTVPSTPTDCLSINSDSSLSDIEFQTQSSTYGQFSQA